MIRIATYGEYLYTFSTVINFEVIFRSCLLLYYIFTCPLFRCFVNRYSAEVGGYRNLGV